MNLCGCELPVGNLTGKINYVSGFELTMTGMNSLAAINIVPCEIQPLLDFNSRSPGTTSCVGQVREQNAPHRQLLARWSLRPVPASWTTFDRSVSLGRLLLLLLLLLWIWLFPPAFGDGFDWLLRSTIGQRQASLPDPVQDLPALCGDCTTR